MYNSTSHKTLPCSGTTDLVLRISNMIIALGYLAARAHHIQYIPIHIIPWCVECCQFDIQVVIRCMSKRSYPPYRWDEGNAHAAGTDGKYVIHVEDEETIHNCV